MKANTVSKKKLMFVIPSLVGGGAERVVVNLINYIDRNKFELVLSIFENKMDLQNDFHFNVNIVCLNKKSRWDFLKLIFKLRKIIADYEPETVISFLQYTNIVIVLSSILLRRNYTLVISEHSYPREYLSKLRLRYLRKWLMKFTYTKADKIIAVSEEIKATLEKYFNIDPEKIIVIYNPIHLEEIRFKSQEKLEHPFFEDKNVQIIISVGRLVNVKRFDRLLKSFSFVRQRQPSARLIILGKGALREELEKLALQLNINNFVSFVGFVHNPYAWISKSDIFVLSSDYEGFPNVLTEAMACGVPVISTNCQSGPNEIINNGKNGLLVPVGDEKALADAILNLLRNKKLRKYFSLKGKQRAEDFRIEKILPEYENLF